MNKYVCVYIFCLKKKQFPINSKKHPYVTLQVIGLHRSSIMSHPHCISPPINQQEEYSHYDPPIPWDLSSLVISLSPCTFSNEPLKDLVQNLKLEEDRFNQLPEGIQHQILCMKTLTFTLDKYKHAYNILSNSK